MSAHAKVSMIDAAKAFIEQMGSTQIPTGKGSLADIEGMFASTAELLMCLETLSEKLHYLDARED
jgi:hypothetical protein